MSQKTIIQLIIAWTLTAVFVFTACATALSLVGWLKFEHASQQEKLFYVLIVEVIAVSIGYFKGFIRFRPDDDSSNKNKFEDKTTLENSKSFPKSLSEIDNAMDIIENQQANLRERIVRLQKDREQIEIDVTQLTTLTHAKQTQNPSPEIIHNISGTWSGESGEMTLMSDGKKITGDYDWQGYPKVGHIEGTFDGQVIIFNWWWDRSQEKGNGFFYFDKNIHKLSGSWFFDYQGVNLPDDIKSLAKDMMHPWSYKDFRPTI